jgi:hypothetical protein
MSSIDPPEAIVDADADDMAQPDPRIALLPMVIWLQMGTVAYFSAAVDMSSTTTVTVPRVVLLTMVIWLPMATVMAASTPYIPLVPACPNLVMFPFVPEATPTCPAAQAHFLVIISAHAIIPLFIRVDGAPVVIGVDMPAAISILIYAMWPPVLVIFGVPAVIPILFFVVRATVFIIALPAVIPPRIPAVPDPVLVIIVPDVVPVSPFVFRATVSLIADMSAANPPWIPTLLAPVLVIVLPAVLLTFLVWATVVLFNLPAVPS